MKRTFATSSDLPLQTIQLTLGVANRVGIAVLAERAGLLQQA